MSHYLLINQFYAPDNAPTGRKLHDLATALVENGHTVEIICSWLPYGGGAPLPRSEDIEGVHVTRINGGFSHPKTKLGKLFNYIDFYLRLTWKLMFIRKRPDLILTLTTPPYLGLVARMSAFIHRTKRAEWIMDLYPDVMVSHGMLREGSIAHRMLRHLAKLDMCKSEFILTLSPEMAERAKLYAPNVEWIPLWGDESLRPMDMRNAEVYALRKARGWASDELVLLYSGNMGLGHSLDEFLDASLHTGPSVRWVFCGLGPRKAQVEKFIAAHPSAKVELLPLVPHEQLNAHLCSADVHLVSVRPEWNGTLNPSKAVNSFAVGKPIIFVGCKNNILTEWINKSGAGWFIENGDINALLNAVAEAEKTIPSDKLASQIRTYHDSVLCAQINIPRIISLMER